MGYSVDLRLTFVLWSVCLVVAGIVALRLEEPDAESPKRHILDRLPSWVGARFAASVAVPMGLVGGVIGKIGRFGNGKNGRGSGPAAG
jgi:hypothetical protein